MDDAAHCDILSSKGDGQAASSSISHATHPHTLAWFNVDLVPEGTLTTRSPANQHGKSVAVQGMLVTKSNKMSTGMLPMDDDADCHILLFSQWNISGSHLGTEPAHTAIVAPGQIGNTQSIVAPLGK